MAVIPKLSRRRKLQILLLDIFVYLASIITVYRFRVGEFDEAYFSSPGLWLILGSLFIFNYILSTYDVDAHRGRYLILNSFLAISVHLAAVISVNYVFQVDRMGLYGRGILLGSALLYVLLSLTYRLAIRKFFKAGADSSTWIIVCDNQIDALIQADQMHGQLRGHYKMVNVVENLNPSSLSDHLKSGYIVAASTVSLPSQWKSFLLDKKMNGEIVIGWADFVEMTLNKIPVGHIESEWLFFTQGYRILQSGWLVRAKRVLDLILALIVFVCALPFIILTAIAVKLDSRGPALYRQKRTGLHGRTFTINKFRSMRIDAEAAGPQWASVQDSRVTRVGNFIRKTRLDELPQLWNVIAGDMSFIGPRPERPEFNKELEKKIPFYNLRHTVRPGLTGWAQVLYPYGASDTDAKHKLEYDLYYIKNYSLLLDILILLRTVTIVLFGRGR